MTPTIGVNLRVTGNCSQGARKHMEDMFSVAYQQTTDQLDLEYAYFGIFDGHGGKEAATFAKKHLMQCIVAQPDFWSTDDEIVCNAIREGFIMTHNAMWNNLDKWPKTASGLPSTSGTTASVAFVRKSKIYVGHVGDSGIILGQQHDDNDWSAVRLTRDHKPESPEELARIQSSGGQVIVKKNVPRVVWQRPSPTHQGPLTRSTHIEQVPFLAVARSLGDLWSYNADTNAFVVSPIPDVFVHKIDLSKDRCLILGTDGLFNMLSPEDVVEYVYKAETNNKQLVDKKHKDKAVGWVNPSKFVVDKALKKWGKMRADNTSAVVMLLDPLGPPKKLRPAPKYEAFFIETYKVKETKSESNGLAICTSSHRLSEGYPTADEKPSCSLNNITVKKEKEEELEEDEKPEVKHSKTLQQSKIISPPRNKKTPRKRKRRSCVRVGRRNNSVCSDTDPIRKTRNSCKVSVRTRRTRSEEPVRPDVRCESDAENVDVPMRLRSATPFKTLRSRNVNLEIFSPSVLGKDEPRPKRLKK